MPLLLAVPNLSEGRDSGRLAALEVAFGRGACLLDRHVDGDHDRTVFTLAGRPGPLMEALLAGAEEALETIDMGSYRGVHPAIGALDVCPLVWLDPADRDAARTEAVADGGADRWPRHSRSSSMESWRAIRDGPSEPTSATAAWPSSGCGWSRVSCDRTSAPPAAPPRRRHPGHRPPAARRLQRRARQRRSRGRPLGCRRSARVGWRTAGGAGDRTAALQRPCPGLDQRPRPAGGAAGGGGRAGARAGGAARRSPARGGAGRPRPRRRPGRLSGRTCRCVASTPIGT